MSIGVSLKITGTRGEFLNVIGPELEFHKGYHSRRVSLKVTGSCELSLNVPA